MLDVFNSDFKFIYIIYIVLQNLDCIIDLALIFPRQYLRGREDTVRYIVTSLTDESCSELSEELLVAAPLVLDDSHSDDDNMDNWETWTPDPVHAHNCKWCNLMKSSV